MLNISMSNLDQLSSSGQTIYIRLLDEFTDCTFLSLELNQNNPDLFQAIQAVINACLLD